MSASVAGLHVVLLAAGSASRFGAPKQAVQLHGVSLVRRAALAALELGAPLIVVTGAHADIVGAELNGLACALTYNEFWEEGMGGSIACGFRELLTHAPAASGAILCLADQALIGAADLRQLADRHLQAPRRIVVAQYDVGGATRGPPCLFPAHLFAELAALRGPRGARAVLERHVDETDALLLPQAAVDIDTIEDYQRLLRQG